MRHIPDDELQPHLELLQELRNLEFKAPFSWDDEDSVWLKEKVVRAILGMTNTRSGGNIIIGVSDKGGKLIRNGLNTLQIESFNNIEGIKGHVDAFSSQPTEFSIKKGEYEGRSYIVIAVSQFDEFPVMCLKNGQSNGILCKDDLYVRSLKAQYSTIKATPLELTEILRTYSDKKMKQYAERGLLAQTEKEEKLEIKDDAIIADYEQNIADMD